MVSVSAADMLRRLKSLIPNGWFRDIAPMRDVVLGGLSDALVWINGQAQVVRAGTRRLGTTGWLLDIDAYGFFGTALLRRSGESDDAWRLRYTNEIFRPRVTRAAVTRALSDLTGKSASILEFWNAGDCGAYNNGTLAYSGGAVIAPRFVGFQYQAVNAAVPPAYQGWASPLAYYGAGTFAYLGPGVLPSAVPTGNTANALGGYGSGYLAYFETIPPYQASIGTGCFGTYNLQQQFTVRPRRGLPPLVNAEGAGAYNSAGFAYGGGQRGTPIPQGWNVGLAYYDTGTFAWSQTNPIQPYFAGSGFYCADTIGTVSDADMNATVFATKAAGVKATVEIQPT